ncbi:MAG TPA: hypothetical protein OIM59_07505 [Bacteroides mediterraneensis]|uniref:hypothetical protein n=1 Tax=Bacteroides mediterraneensis TaxID=1841856 RepID=UPI0026EF3F4C|nr:hypothetical protein [Bacteroides mediterraneensis]HJH64464.1 hypothetical protein [Bacteroides mediterraneensis]
MELTEENLEYITFVAMEYCHLPEFNDEYSRLNASIHAKSIFKARYETLNDTFQKAYQEYSQNEKIKSTINIYQLDSNKLWLLFLFITDFTESCFYEDTNTEKLSINDFCKECISLIENSNDINITVTSDKRISLKNPVFIKAFKDFCEILIQQPNNNLMNIKFYQTIIDEKGKHEIKKITLFVKMFRYFLDNHVKVRKPSKMTFIGKLLFLGNFVTEESYLTEYNPTPITTKNKFKIKLYGTVFINGKEYIKDYDNIGKRIADNIKKCTDTTPTSISNYIDYPLDF